MKKTKEVFNDLCNKCKNPRFVTKEQLQEGMKLKQWVEHEGKWVQTYQVFTIKKLLCFMVFFTVWEEDADIKIEMEEDFIQNKTILFK